MKPRIKVINTWIWEGAKGFLPSYLSWLFKGYTTGSLKASLICYMYMNRIHLGGGQRGSNQRTASTSQDWHLSLSQPSSKSCTSHPSNWSDHIVLNITVTGTKTLTTELLKVFHAGDQNKSWAKPNWSPPYTEEKLGFRGFIPQTLGTGLRTSISCISSCWILAMG